MNGFEEKETTCTTTQETDKGRDPTVATEGSLWKGLKMDTTSKASLPAKAGRRHLNRPEFAPIGHLATLRGSVEVDPAVAKQGMQIGLLTIVGEPVMVMRHDACHWLAHPVSWPFDVASAIAAGYKRDDFTCKGVIARYYAHVRCQCGAELTIELTGNRCQHVACPACYRAMRYGHSVPSKLANVA